MKIQKLTQEYFPYVISILQKRWDLSEMDAQEEIDRWMDEKNNSICFIGLIDEKPIATGVFDITSDVDYSIPCWNTLLWVEPEHRGNGYGYMLTQKRFAWAKEHNYKCVYLDTINAKEYHLKFGWNIVREFVKEEELYVIMKYDL